MSEDQDFSNRSANRSFDAIPMPRRSRRQIPIGGAATAATSFLGGTNSALALGGKRRRDAEHYTGTRVPGRRKAPHLRGAALCNDL